MELILMADFVLMLLTQLQASPLHGHLNKSHYCRAALSKKKLFMERAKVSLDPLSPQIIYFLEITRSFEGMAEKALLRNQL